MNTIATLITAGMAAFSAAAGFLGVSFVTESLTAYGVPRGWWPWLSTAKAAGALGLLVGLYFYEPIGIAAAIGLLLYFVGAVITVVRAKHYSHIPFPLVYLAPVVVTLVLSV